MTSTVKIAIKSATTTCLAPFSLPPLPPLKATLPPPSPSQTRTPPHSHLTMLEYLCLALSACHLARTWAWLRYDISVCIADCLCCQLGLAEGLPLSWRGTWFAFFHHQKEVIFFDRPFSVWRLVRKFYEESYMRIVMILLWVGWPWVGDQLIRLWRWSGSSCRSGVKLRDLASEGTLMTNCQQ